jgi:hypothetical protein
MSFKNWQQEIEKSSLFLHKSSTVPGEAAKNFRCNLVLGGINLPTPNKGLKPLAELPNGRKISAKDY